MYKVLLVDDEVYVRKGLMNLIDWDRYGFEVYWEASNGEDALKIIAEEKPDVVITDVRMPVIDGLELIKRIRDSGDTETQFIIVSGYNDFSYAQKAVRYNVFDFVLKPVDQDELEEILIKLGEKLKVTKVEKIQKKKLKLEQAIESLLKANITNAEITEWLKLLEVEESKFFYYVLIEINNIHFVDKIEEKSFMLMNAIEEVIKKLSQVTPQVAIYEQTDHAVGLLVPAEYIKKMNGRIKYFAEQLMKELSKQITNEKTMFIGEKVESLADFKTSYETANDIRKYKYIISRENIISYEDMKDTSVNYNEVDSKLYLSLLEHIEENNVPEIKKHIDKIFSDFISERFAAQAVETSVNRCIHGIIQTIKSMEGNAEEMTTLHKIIRWEDYQLTLPELKKMLTEFLLESSLLIKELRKENLKGDIYKIKTYIENNYHQNISLKSIANKFYMNPVYMGQLFKKTFGIFFKEFLLTLRIDEAKKLLRQTDMRVYEVADKVGFGSTDYFVTQFEKINKMTPTEYRNQLLNKEKKE